MPGESSKYCVEECTVKVAKVRRTLARCTQLLHWAGSQWAKVWCSFAGVMVKLEWCKYNKMETILGLSSLGST